MVGSFLCGRPHHFSLLLSNRGWNGIHPNFVNWKKEPLSFSGGSLFNHVRETLNRVRIRVEVPEQLELQNDRAYDYVNALRNRLNPDVSIQVVWSLLMRTPPPRPLMWLLSLCQRFWSMARQKKWELFFNLNKMFIIMPVETKTKFDTLIMICIVKTLYRNVLNSIRKSCRQM